MLSIIQLIREELENFYDYDKEQGMADKYYQSVVAVDPAPKEKVNAELVGYVTKQYGKKLSEGIPVYKNPQTLTGFGYDTRGVLLNNGNFYVAKSWSAMHDDMLDLLSEKNIIPYATVYRYYTIYPEEFIAVQRQGTSNVFGQSSAYDDFPPYYEEIFQTGNKKQPFGFKAYPPDANVNELESPLDPNNLYSNIPPGHNANILYEIGKMVREESDDIYGNKNRGKLKRTGEKFWIGSVNVMDGEIEEVHTYEEARDNDFHHNFYFSPAQVEKFTEGECMIFWINEDGIQAEWTMGKASPDIVNKIKQQIKFI